jgi:hypothetical protein
MIAKDYQDRIDVNNSTFAAYDAYEIHDKIVVRYGHRDDFKQLPGSGLLMMALET